MFQGHADQSWEYKSIQIGGTLHYISQLLVHLYIPLLELCSNALSEFTVIGMHMFFFLICFFFNIIIFYIQRNNSYVGPWLVLCCTEPLQQSKKKEKGEKSCERIWQLKCNNLILLYLTVQNKVRQSGTPQGTVQQHKHTIWDITLQFVTCTTRWKQVVTDPFDAGYLCLVIQYNTVQYGTSPSTLHLHRYTT